MDAFGFGAQHVVLKQTSKESLGSSLVEVGLRGLNNSPQKERTGRTFPKEASRITNRTDMMVPDGAPVVVGRRRRRSCGKKRAGADGKR